MTFFDVAQSLVDLDVLVGRLPALHWSQALVVERLRPVTGHRTSSSDRGVVGQPCIGPMDAAGVVWSLVIAAGRVSTAVVATPEACRRFLLGENVDRVGVSPSSEPHIRVPVLLVSVIHRLVALLSVNAGSASASREPFKFNSL